MSIDLAPAPLPGAGAVVPAGRRARRGATDPRAPLGAGSSLSLGVVVLWMSLLVLLPMAAVVSKAFDGGWGQFVDDITKPVNLDALELSLVLAVSVALVN